MKVTAVSENAITTDAANFVNQQAIVKFTLKDKATDAAINANKLTISAASNKLVLKKTLVAIGDKIYHSGYTATDGKGTGGEGYEKLVDGDLETKWCADNGPWFIEFHTASPIKVDGYMLRTGGDTDTNSGRNPKSWELKGKLNEGDATWTPSTRKPTTPRWELLRIKSMILRPLPLAHTSISVWISQITKVMDTCSSLK